MWDEKTQDMLPGGRIDHAVDLSDLCQQQGGE